MLSSDLFKFSLSGAIVSPKRWKFNYTLLLIASIGYSFLSLRVFQGVPRLDDSVAALFQARIFNTGNLTWPVSVQLQPWFDIFGVLSPIDKPDHWVGMYTPGWPLLLSIGTQFGCSWLVNPVLGGLLCVVIVEITTDIYGELAGRVAGILALLSPHVSIMSASHLSHVSAALFVSLAWLSTARLLSTRRWGWALAAGASIGFTLLIRSETAFFIGVVIAVGTLIQFRRALSVWKQLVTATIVAFMFVAVLTAWQHYAIGAAGTFGHHIEMGDLAKFGFGQSTRVNYSFHNAVPNTIFRLRAVHTDILGWPIPALVLLLAPFLLVRPRWHSLWLMLPLAVLTMFFFFFWYYEEWLPGRYLFSSVPFLFVLMGEGWRVWHKRLAQFPSARALPTAMLVLGSLFTIAFSAPKYYQSFTPHHADVEDSLKHYISHHKLDNALVLYRSVGTLGAAHYGQWNDFYTTAFMLNDLDLNGKVVIARDNAHRAKDTAPLDNRLLFAMYPDREYYLYTFNQSNKRSTLYALEVEDNTIVGKKRMSDPLNIAQVPTEPVDLQNNH